MSRDDLAALALELCASAALFSEVVKKTLYHGHALDVGRLQAVLERVEDALLAAEEGVEELAAPLPPNYGGAEATSGPRAKKRLGTGD